MMQLCGFEVGLDRPLFLIAGPCVIAVSYTHLDVYKRQPPAPSDRARD